MNQESFFQNPLVRLLTRPHSSITEPAAQQRARILATVLLVLLITAIFALLIGMQTGGNLLIGSLIAGLLFAVCYSTSRTESARFAAPLLVFGLSAMAFGALGLLPDPAIVGPLLTLVPVPVILSTLVLPARGTMIATGLTIAGLILAALFVPWIDLQQAIVPISATILISVAATIAVLMRERDIATISKQAEDLSRYSATLEAEVKNVITTAQVGQAITGTRDQEQLLKQVVNLIRERFRFSQVHVFLMDDQFEFAILRESSGEIGRRLVEQDYRQAVGAQSVIGQVTLRNQPVIVADAANDPLYRGGENLPSTRSELALPLIAGGRLIGVLDIHSSEPNAFKESDVRVFLTMADQLAVAIENARLFEQAQRDLEEIERLNRRLTAEGWRRYQDGRGAAPVGYEASNTGIKPIRPGESAETSGPSTISLPLLVRGEPIGLLDVTSRDGSPPDEQMQSILQAVAERVALALDSTRLGDTAIRQAERQQVLGRLSAELQATTDLDVILQVAAREASHALGTSRGFVHLTMEYGGESRSSSE